MTDWQQLNSKKVALAGLTKQLMVSSWAIVVDVTWKKDFAPVRVSSLTPQYTAPYTYQPVGSTGDTIGVYVNVPNVPRNVNQGALLLRRTVTKVGTNLVGGVQPTAQEDSVVGTTNAFGL